MNQNPNGGTSDPGCKSADQSKDNPVPKFPRPALQNPDTLIQTFKLFVLSLNNYIKASGDLFQIFRGDLDVSEPLLVPREFICGVLLTLSAYFLCYIVSFHN